MYVCESCGREFESDRVYAGHRSARSRNGYCDPPMSRRTLKHEYLYRGKSHYEIADEYGYSPASIRNWCHHYDIRVTKGYTAPELHLPQYLEWAYVKKGLTAYDIADRIGSGQQGVCRALKRCGIDVRDQVALPGEDNYAWNGGVSDWYYGSSWAKQRKKRRKKDDHECVVCGMSNGEHKQRHNKALHVHHIEPVGMFRDEDGSIDEERAHRIENLITLCYKCHNRWEGVPLRPQVSD